MGCFWVNKCRKENCNKEKFTLDRKEYSENWICKSCLEKDLANAGFRIESIQEHYGLYSVLEDYHIARFLQYIEKDLLDPTLDFEFRWRMSMLYKELAGKHHYSFKEICQEANRKGICYRYEEFPLDVITELEPESEGGEA